ncbi:MAG: ABC transporter substrate-binding protein [Chloroflexi bacterium]|nr:MAG: ABC transporter substrate-binding protein [Chloroflexota bacterium]
MRSRRSVLRLIGLGGVGSLGLMVACRTSPPAVPSGGPPATTAPIVPGQATAPPGVAAPTTAPAPATNAAIKRGGQATILQTNDFVSMDPVFASGPTASACYDYLLAWRPNPDGTYGVQPLLARAWETSADKIVFHLRDGIKFHDGSDLTADVVVWNINRMVQNPKSFARNYLSAVDANNPATATDPLTVQLNLTRPSAAVLSSLSDATSNGGGTTAIVSKKAAEDHGEEWLALNPVGTGPFRFVSFTSGDKLQVQRNENYWRTGADGKPLPHLDGITYRVIIEATTQFNELRAGTSDFAQNIRGRDVPAGRQIAHAHYLESPFSGNKRQYFFNSLKPPFQDNLNLRQAIHHAVDREAIARAVGGGFGFPLPYEFVPGSIGYDPAVPYYEFNPDKARAQLQASGVTMPLEVRMTVHSREQDVQQAQLIQQMVDKIGIKLNLEVVERVAWGEKVRIQNDFQMASRQSGVQVDPTDDLLVTWAEGGNSAYHRAHVPGLIDTLHQADAEYDAAKRQALFVEAQKLMYESAWFGYIWFEPGNFLVHNRIQGFPAAWGSLREAEWWIDPSV